MGRPLRPLGLVFNNVGWILTTFCIPRASISWTRPAKNVKIRGQPFEEWMITEIFWDSFTLWTASCKVYYNWDLSVGLVGFVPLSFGANNKHERDRIFLKIFLIISRVIMSEDKTTNPSCINYREYVVRCKIFLQFYLLSQNI